LNYDSCTLHSMSSGTLCPPTFFFFSHHSVHPPHRDRGCSSASHYFLHETFVFYLSIHFSPLRSRSPSKRVLMLEHLSLHRPAPENVDFFFFPSTGKCLTWVPTPPFGMIYFVPYFSVRPDSVTRFPFALLRLPVQ